MSGVDKCRFCSQEEARVNEWCFCEGEIDYLHEVFFNVFMPANFELFKRFLQKEKDHKLMDEIEHACQSVYFYGDHPIPSDKFQELIDILIKDNKEKA